ncbi:MAG TPA: MFS transporter [Actinomycetota bacterium]|nr:MFS transporter [Actinomycetota bacterium]
MTSTTESNRSAGVRDILSDRAVTTVIALSFVMMFGLGIVLPVLPLYARSFGVGYAAAGFIVSGFGLARLGAGAVAGSIIDRVGERRASSGGLALLAVCSAATGLAPAYWAAVLAWSVGGMGSAVMIAAQYSYLLRTVPRDRMARTLGLFYGSFNAGLVAGGFVGGVLAETFGLASPLHAYAALLALAAVLYWRLVPEPRRAAPAETAPHDAARATRARGAVVELLRRREVVTTIVVNFAYMWVVAALFDTLVPLFASDEFGMSPAGIGVVFSITLATEFVVLYPAGTLADRHGRKAVLVPSLAALSVLAAAVAFAPTIVAFGAVMAVLGIASGFAGVPPAAMLSDVVPEERSGIGVGMFRFAGDLSFFVAPVLVGSIASGFGFRWAFALAAAPVAVALVLVARTAETMRR